MTITKRQHYVPQFLLRFFSDLSNVKSKSIISMYMLEQNTIKEKIPIKSVCYCENIYGDDDIVEKMFSEIESDWARVLNQMNISNRHIIKRKDKSNIASFIASQYLRTKKREAFLERMTAEWIKYIDPKDAALFQNKLENNSSISMNLSLIQFRDFRKYLSDLDYVILDNESNTEFIISDNPVIFINIFSPNNFGVHSIGNILWIPISPRKLLLLYDRKAINLTAGGFKISSDETIKAINSYQYIVMDKLLFNIHYDLNNYIFYEDSIKSRAIYENRKPVQKFNTENDGLLVFLFPDFLNKYIDLNFIRLDSLLVRIPYSHRYNISRYKNLEQLYLYRKMFNDVLDWETFKKCILEYWVRRI